MLLELCEKLIWLVDSESDVAFFDSSRFSWVNTLETHWKSIHSELEVVLDQYTYIPNIQDLSEDQRILTEGEDWKTFFL